MDKVNINKNSNKGITIRKSSDVVEDKKLTPAEKMKQNLKTDTSVATAKKKKSKKVKISIDIEEDVLERIDAIAEDDDRSRADVIRKALKQSDYINNYNI
jgi:uncharacterized protein (DUF4415 family)